METGWRGLGRDAVRAGNLGVFCELRPCLNAYSCYVFRPFMKAEIHPKYVDSEIRCACGNVIKTRSTKPTIIVGICNVCHPFYTGQQKFVDTAGRVDKFQQRMLKTQAAQAAAAAPKKKKK
jgi:large subunit ribosomal protein L31